MTTIRDSVTIHSERFSLDFPDDFPVGEVEEIQSWLSDRVAGISQTIEWREWNTGLNGVIYRFLACDETSASVTDSLRASAAPPQPERFQQERDLFGLFFHGFSSLECLYYALYFVGARAAPDDFDVDINRKLVTPRKV